MSFKLTEILGMILAGTVAGVVAFAVGPAYAAVSADVEMGYVNFQSEVKGSPVNDVTAQSFRHKYSLMYSTENTIGNRSGYYKVGLGYEWGAIKSKVETAGLEDEISVGKGHMLYRGHLYFNPRELPVRLRLYSYDTRRLSLLDEGGTTLFSSMGYILKPGIPTDIENGSSFVSGATLLLGYKPGQQNDLNLFFSGMPAILIDYMDTINQSHSRFPREDRLRKTAFVLSKGANWLHYRYTQYDNVLRSTENYAEKEVIIGNIDPTLYRRWVALTNWISVSADGQYRETTNTKMDKDNEYSVHLFTLADRDKWDAKLFNTFERRQENSLLTYETRNPLYMSGTWTADTDWRSNLVYNAMKQTYGSPGSTISIDQDDAVASLRLNTMKRSYFSLSPAVAVEKFDRGSEGASVFEASIDAASTRRFSDRISLAAGYDAKVFFFTGDTESTYVAHTLTGRMSTKPRKQLRIEFREDASLVSGTRNPRLPTYIYPIVAVGAGAASSSNSDNSVFRSVSNVKAAWDIKPRFGIDWGITYDLLQPDSGETTFTTTLVQRTRYDGVNFKLYSDLAYSLYSAQEDARVISVGAGASYTPSRAISASLAFTYFDADYASDISRNYEIEQKLQYLYFKRGGGRKLFDVSEILKYEVDKLKITRKLTTLQISSNYYPFRNVYLSAAGTYKVRNPDKTTEYTAGIGAGVTYVKLQAGIDYAYGRRDDRDTRIDKRVSATVRKQF